MPECPACDKEIEDREKNGVWAVTGPEEGPSLHLYHAACRPNYRTSLPKCVHCSLTVERTDPGIVIVQGMTRMLYHPRCKRPVMKSYEAHLSDRAAIRETCWTCSAPITESDPGAKLYDGPRLVAIKHNRCELAPLKDALSELEDTVIVKRGEGGLSVAEAADPDEVKELRRRSEILQRAMEAIIKRIEASEGYFPWESERKARIRLSILVTCSLVAALSALLVSAVTLWRTL
jgi:hypothetical protein